MSAVKTSEAFSDYCKRMVIELEVYTHTLPIEDAKAISEIIATAFSDGYWVGRKEAEAANERVAD